MATGNMKNNYQRFNNNIDPISDSLDSSSAATFVAVVRIHN